MSLKRRKSGARVSHAKLFIRRFVYFQRDFSVMEKSGSSATDGALRPARHLSENASKHPEKSGTSESKHAMNNPSARSRGKHGYKMRKLKISFLFLLRKRTISNRIVIGAMALIANLL